MSEENITVKEWAAKFLETYIEGGVSKTTFDGYRSLLNNFVVQKIGHLNLCDVKQIHCQGLIKDMGAYTKEYVKKTKYLMCRMFKAAKKNGLIAEDPAEDLRMPETKKDGTRRSITEPEREIFLKTAETHPYGLLLKVILYTGIRPGEAAALQGRHVDLESSELCVEQARKKTGEIGTPKTAAGIRSVPIPEILMAEMKNLNVEPFEYVFPNRRGGVRTAASMTKSWRSFKRAMRIVAGHKTVIADDFVPYCLRHTFCTDLQAAGVPLNIAKYLMGHSDVKMTANIYTHTTEGMISSARRAIDAYHKSGDY
jgi:integrase